MTNYGALFGMGDPLAQSRRMQSFYAPINRPDNWRTAASGVPLDIGGFPIATNRLVDAMRTTRIDQPNPVSRFFGADPKVVEEELTPEQKKLAASEIRRARAINPPANPTYGVAQLGRYGVGRLRGLGVGAMPTQFGPMFQRRF